MKTIFITGSSSGLGKATAKLFAQKGWNVIASMRHPENENELVSIPNIHLLQLDVTNKESIQKAVEAAIQIGSVDVVFNNAGYGLTGPLEGYTDDQITRQFNTNVLGVIRVTQEFLPHLRERKEGLIINTTSIGGLVTFPFSSIYHATKWAIEGWSESMSYELATQHIKIKTISPGGIATDFMTRSIDMGKHEAYATYFDKFIAGFNNPDSPLQFSAPESIAEVVYEAAIDGKDQLRYLAGNDAVSTYEYRLNKGSEAFRKGVVKGLIG
ncbi:SDR family oxidoreductase [Chryseobacterium daecheongense]|uniref:NADP-dependent 3-hydroxy acid dehydrogenase YdfG n=1 Tax=Chryseobacterium daecheongense TaxID=192389 RepID=A0A3N0W5H2_9FLAO|nr:SDR family oxidoreductase [Chryseobacterium daecheongense]ROI00273.1 SDR family oxidoreductase [Chryseobacterium daecheongense]TDX94768.1 NADP-dependent 3-hydroxy acid dehydrogenase YdfG [Chryseobacterium daecheongense]